MSDTQARDEVLRILLNALENADEARALALALGEEVRAGVLVDVRQEHEDDLVRARERSFDYGVRTALRALRDAGRIGAEEEDALALRFAAGPTLDLAAVHDELVPWLGPGNDDQVAIHQADTVVDILRRLIP